MTEENIKKQMVSVKGIFRQGDKFLVLKEDNEMWELPGGKVEFGENIDTCFAREHEEELGWVNCETDKIVHIWNLNSEDGIQYIIICATAEPSDDPIKLSAEHIEYKWLTIAEIEKLNIYPDFTKAIKKSVEE